MCELDKRERFKNSMDEIGDESDVNKTEIKSNRGSRRKHGDIMRA